MDRISLFSKLTFFVFFVFAFNNIYGRSEYLPGYIIKLPGDTVQGFIKYRNWSETPTKIFFKQQLESDLIKEYTCADLYGFKVANEIYVRAIVKIDESKLNADDLDLNSDMKFITDTVFLEAMIQGLKSLYYYGNKSIKAQFYIKQDSTYELLIYKKYLNEQGTRYTENKRYINQLALYLNDCPDIKENFTNISYTKQSLEKLFMQFYNCTNNEITFQKKTEKAIFQSSIIAGISLTSLSFTGTGYPYLVSADWDNSVNFTGGFSFNLMFPRNFNKLSFNNELLYTEYKVKGIYTDYTNDNEYTVNTSIIGLSYLKYNTMLRYNQAIANAFIFINSGISCGFAFNETNSYTREKVFYSEPSFKEFDALSDIRNLEIAYNIGLGSKYKKYSAEIRYERGNGFSDFDTLKVRSKRLYFLLGFSF